MSTESGPMPPALQARSRLTQSRIIAAGTRLLQEGGSEALTVAGVAEAAGVSVGSVYRRFGDKDRLLAVIQARFSEDFGAEFRRHVADIGLGAATPPAEVIVAAVVGTAEAFRLHAALLRVFMLLGSGNPAVYEQGAIASTQGGRAFRETLLLAGPALRHHPDVEAAIDFAYRLVYAACAHRIIWGEHLESARALPWEELISQLQRAVIAYLLGPIE